jgi:hypothetical protein
MTSRIYRPEHKHPQPAQQDLNPDASKGLNWGVAGPHPEKDARSAYDNKEVHRVLRDFSDDELKRLVILPEGACLEANATYVNLRDPELREFTAEGNEEAGQTDLIIPKSEVDYELWNKLLEASAATADLSR